MYKQGTVSPFDNFQIARWKIIAAVAVVILGLPALLWLGLPLAFRPILPWIEVFWNSPLPIMIVYKALLITGICVLIGYFVAVRPLWKYQAHRQHRSDLHAERERQHNNQALAIISGSPADLLEDQKSCLEQSDNCLKVFCNIPRSRGDIPQEWGKPLPWARFHQVEYGKNHWGGAVADRNIGQNDAKLEYMNFQDTWSEVQFPLGINIFGVGLGSTGLSCNLVWGHWLTSSIINGKEVAWWDVILVDPIAEADAGSTKEDSNVS